MAYYSGQATNYNDLLNALVNACIAHGWTWADEILSKGQIAIKLQIVSNHITALAGNGSTLNNPAPAVVRLGALDGQTITFPFNYHLFIFENPDEVYLIIKNGIDKFLWLSFGCSTLTLSASGVWVAATKAATNAASCFISSTEGGVGVDWSGQTPAAPFWNTDVCFNAFINHGFDGVEWNRNIGSAKDILGSAITVQSLVPLLSRQPSNWNSSTIFIPIPIFINRNELKKTLACIFENARYVCINNFEPEQIIQLGNEKWMIFPFYKKNPVKIESMGEDHTANFGWAIRYDGL